MAYNLWWQRVYALKGKERKVLFLLQFHTREAPRLIISSGCHTNLFYSTSIATFSLESTKIDASIVYFLAFDSIPHNDQSCTYTYRSERADPCMRFRILFPSPNKNLRVWQFVRLTVVEKHNYRMFSVSCGAGYCSAAEVQHQWESSWRNNVIKSEPLFIGLLFHFICIRVF